MAVLYALPCIYPTSVTAVQLISIRVFIGFAAGCWSQASGGDGPRGLVDEQHGLKSDNAYMIHQPF